MNQGRKITGGKYHANRKKTFFEHERQERKAVLGERRVKTLRGRGGNDRTVILREHSVNVIQNGKCVKATISNVLETPQNRFLARQNRLSKGAIIETSVGKARITNRPTQEGNVNAVALVEGEVKSSK